MTADFQTDPGHEYKVGDHVADRCNRVSLVTKVSVLYAPVGLYKEPYRYLTLAGHPDTVYSSYDLRPVDPPEIDRAIQRAANVAIGYGGRSLTHAICQMVDAIENSVYEIVDAR